MQELEKILEEINEEIKSSIAFSSVFTDGLCRARNIIINHLSRESTQEITISSRDIQFGECSQREVYMKAYEDALNEDSVSEAFLADCKRVAQKYKKDNDDWIPVEERLPTMEEYQKDDGRFILDDGNRRCAGYFNVYTGRFYSYQHITQYMAELHENNWVIAWHPLPEPYRPERNNEE